MQSDVGRKLQHLTDSIAAAANSGRRVVLLVMEAEQLFQQGDTGCAKHHTPYPPATSPTLMVLQTAPPRKQNQTSQRVWKNVYAIAHLCTRQGDACGACRMLTAHGRVMHVAHCPVLTLVLGQQAPHSSTKLEGRNMGHARTFAQGSPSALMVMRVARAKC
eukprot:1161525-Pelagomonas_calceolata.AAC.15